MAELAASIIAGDHGFLANTVAEAEANGIARIHIDAIDGHFQPAIAFGPATVRDLRARSPSYFDVHLMLVQPERHLESYAAAGADGMTVHLDVGIQHHRQLASIRRLGCRAGLALYPGTAVERAVELLRLGAVDVLLLLTRNPGFAEATFLEQVRRRIDLACRIREEFGLDYQVEVDGHIDEGNIRAVTDAGADIVVCGASLYRNGTIEDRAARLRTAMGQPAGARHP